MATIVRKTGILRRLHVGALLGALVAPVALHVAAAPVGDAPSRITHVKTPGGKFADRLPALAAGR